jgi:hypothetical protein
MQELAVRENYIAAGWWLVAGGWWLVAVDVDVDVDVDGQNALSVNIGRVS